MVLVKGQVVVRAVLGLLQVLPLQQGQQLPLQSAAAGMVVVM